MEDVLAAIEADDFERAFDRLLPLRDAVGREVAIARTAVGVILGMGASPAEGPEWVLDALQTRDPQVLVLASAWVLTRDPALTATQAEALAAALEAALPTQDAAELDRAGSVSFARARLFSGAGLDTQAEAAFRRARALAPEQGSVAHDFGLWLKQRARFAEALEALQMARVSLAEDEALGWNLAIVATGAGDGRAASLAWRQLGHEVQRGVDGLPHLAGLAEVVVRLVAEDGVEVDVWVRPESPVHGFMRSVPTHPGLPAGYADLILWDGEPLDELLVGSRRVHRFPFLARLRPSEARLFEFRGSGELAVLTASWPDALWLSGPVGSGRLVVEAELSLEDALREIERARAAHPEVEFEVLGLTSSSE